MLLIGHRSVSRSADKIVFTKTEWYLAVLVSCQRVNQQKIFKDLREISIKKAKGKQDKGQ